ncbi:unnamed protein product [Microthlaspi erraticum]|uniref:ADP-ribosyl cyclase/cyclic ADP-ribose hydrolase n=1 Tax=Microthlaspi erraticum TaxID=1685480 RepID=A0A6D2IBJ5_9BRAS|nr:unnamed protein product [Microthlaspi erraticum]
MASSSSPAYVKRFHVFPSFHGADVRRGFLSHLHNFFASKGIKTFKDQEIERGNTIGPELVKAIRESRMSIVLLSTNYASSSWCLDELVEILRCKEDLGHMVMTLFYNVDPSSVRKQKGDFGSAFMKTCEGKTEEVKQRWSKALTDVANIEGEHYINWANEADMIKKIATDISNKLNLSPSRDFEGMVGMKAHLTNLNSLLCLECDDVKMIGIWGPAGIGKTTIARALYNLLSSDFRLRCFMGNLRGGSYKSKVGVDDYESKLDLQNILLSKVLSQRDIGVDHLGMVKQWLKDQKVLIILDDVDDLEQLEVLAKELSWFGYGSRIIVTTEDKKILVAHMINDIYHVEFPSDEEALEMLCLSAFKQRSVPDGFEEVARKVAKLCGNLPLGLSVVGSSLRGESKEEWELQLSRIESSLDRKVEDILRVGYDRLSKKDQSLFLHMACFFNNTSYDVRSMLADSNLDVENGLKTLAVKSLVQIPYHNRIEMHSLLEQMGRQIVHEQSDEPGKRQFLVEPQEIRDVLANKTGTGSVIGISLDMSKMDEFSVSGRAFEGMRNLRFLRIYGSQLGISEEMEYLPRLRLLWWPYYPRKRLPQKFQPECLIRLFMSFSNLEKLWDGIQPLPNLEEIHLEFSAKLKEIPNLSKATSLKTLYLKGCTSLVELPCSIQNLHKLEKLKMNGCVKLRVIPTNINLASLEEVKMNGCSRLRSFPDFSSNIKHLDVGNTSIEDVPASVAGRWSRVTEINLSNIGIKKIPDCIIGLLHLTDLIIRNCRKLESLQSLPPSLLKLDAAGCGSLKSVCFWLYEPRACITVNDSKCVKSEKDTKRVSSPTFYNPIREVSFLNCLSLSEEARRVIIQRWAYMSVSLPGKQVPADFTHKAKGNSITISSGTFSVSSRFKACLLLTPTGQVLDIARVVCRLISKRVIINELEYCPSARLSRCLEVDATTSEILTEHLFVFSGSLFKCVEVDATTSDIFFEFSCDVNDANIIECGVQILRDEVESSSRKRKEPSDGAVEVCKDGWWSRLKSLV